MHDFMDDEVAFVLELGNPCNPVFDIIVVIEKILKLLRRIEQVCRRFFEPVVKFCFRRQKLESNHECSKCCLDLIVLEERTCGI